MDVTTRTTLTTTGTITAIRFVPPGPVFLPVEPKKMCKLYKFAISFLKSIKFQC